MENRLSKLAKIIIILNIVFTLTIGIVHGYNVHRINETNDKIYQVMDERDISRHAAIEFLEAEGEELYIGGEFGVYFGVFMTFVSLVLLYSFAKYNGFFLGFFTAGACFFTTFIGGILLFYVILSEKSQVYGKSDAYSLNTEWEKSIHKKVKAIDATSDKD